MWATPLEALLIAERCAALSRNDTDFTLITTLAYTGMRWSEVIGFSPESVKSRPAVPVLADVDSPFPGGPLPPWPAAVPGEAFTPPAGRGRLRLVSGTATGRCLACGRAQRRRLDGRLITHKAGGHPCDGSGQPPADDVAVASWLPVLTGLTPHGLRHGHQTWMDEAGIPYVLQSERMGHEVPGMRGVYGHVSPAMRDALTAALQECWETLLRDRARLSPRSHVPLVDVLLAGQRSAAAKIGSHSAPRIGHASRERHGSRQRIGR